MSNIPDKVKKDMACDRIGRKLVKYLEENKAKGIIDFRLRIDSDTHFYIHPQDKDGETLDISWDWTKATYGNEVFGYTNQGNKFDDPKHDKINVFDLGHVAKQTRRNKNKPKNE